MKTESTTYKCDNIDCDKEVIITKTPPIFGPSPIKDWIVPENGVCYCSVECFIADNA